MAFFVLLVDGEIQSKDPILMTCVSKSDKCFVTSGPGLLMLRSMVAGSTTAAIFGLGLSVISSVIWGTAALPFIIGSSVGFAVGSVRWYIQSTSEALSSLQDYPALLRLHLLANFPRDQRLRTWEMSQFRPAVFDQSWTLRSMLVASWLTARPALDDIHTRIEANVVDGYTEGKA